MLRGISLLTGILFIGGFLNAQSDSLKFSDDPIAAMLDSLAHNRYIESLPKQQTQHNNKFHYAADSIPTADPAVVESRLAKLNAASPFDLIYNEDVQTYINLYVVKKRPLVEKMLGLSQLYDPIFEEQLDKYNLPLELKNLPVIESALNPSATSHAGARGLWQFMYTTGKMYDLEVSSYVDERCDPYRSTEAACQCLRDLYNMFGDWQMVLAAYNAGPGTVNKAIRRAGGGKKSYWEIRPFLPKETQAYVPAFIAANYVMSYHLEHNLYSAIPRKAFSDIDTVAVKQQVTFSQIEAVLAVSQDELEFLNPEYKLDVIPYSFTEPYKLVLPIDKVGPFVTNEQAIYDYIKKDTAMAAMAIVEVKTTHTVKKGETITSIARRYKCSVTDIRAWNGLKSNYIKPGQKLVIYTPERVSSSTDSDTAEKDPKEKSGSTSTDAQKNSTKTKTSDPDPGKNDPAPNSSGAKYKYYTVKKGDNLYTISKSTGVSVEQLKKLNGFGDHFVMHAGDKIKIAKI
ncbi:MAG: LysM peptidoglycan-binding domain-containing protein [Bacteroidetes bacterium]|nr:LysM peptidoglycan-binding domain-containing protein [Bacteroidota bacterium]